MRRHWAADAAQRLPWGAIPGEIGAWLAVADSAIGQLEVFVRTNSFLMERALIVNRAALANRAGRDFVTAGDLGDFLMIQEQIEPKAARTIAGMVISRARTAGLEASGITAEMIDTAALMVIGREIKVDSKRSRSTSRHAANRAPQPDRRSGSLRCEIVARRHGTPPAGYAAH